METRSPTSALGQQVILSHIPVQPEQSRRDEKVREGTFVAVQQKKKKNKRKRENENQQLRAKVDASRFHGSSKVTAQNSPEPMT